VKTYDENDLRAWFRAKAEDYFRAHPEVDPAWYRDLDFVPEEARFRGVAAASKSRLRTRR
jgi:hypothetical protein